MPSFLPFAGPHSIVEVAIGIHLAGPIDPASVHAAKDSLSAQLGQELPNVENIAVVQVAVGSEAGRPGVPGLGGFNLRRLKPDGQAARILRVMGDVVTVNHMAYDKWSECLESSIRYLTVAVAELSNKARPVVASSLRILDRFTFDGSPNQANPLLLLKAESDMIAPRVLRAGPRWHSHTGWYEGHRGNIPPVLNQLNIDGVIADGAVAGVGIDHNQMLLYQPPTMLGDVVRGSSSVPPIGDFLNLAFAQNKACLKSLLTEEMAAKISLEDPNG